MELSREHRDILNKATTHVPNCVLEVGAEDNHTVLWRYRGFGVRYTPQALSFWSAFQTNPLFGRYQNRDLIKKAFREGRMRWLGGDGYAWIREYLETPPPEDCYTNTPDELPGVLPVGSRWAVPNTTDEGIFVSPMVLDDYSYSGWGLQGDRLREVFIARKRPEWVAWSTVPDPNRHKIHIPKPIKLESPLPSPIRNDFADESSYWKLIKNKQAQQAKDLLNRPYKRQL